MLQTEPTERPADDPPLWIGIDHALTTPGAAVVSRRLGAANGSDHRPLVVDVAVVAP